MNSEIKSEKKDVSDDAKQDAKSSPEANQMMNKLFEDDFENGNNPESNENERDQDKADMNTLFSDDMEGMDQDDNSIESKEDTNNNEQKSETEEKDKDSKLEDGDSNNNEKNEKDNEKKIEKELPERMEPPTVITFKCPDGVDKKEFERQLKAQERGINSQSVQKNMDNREAYQKRKEENDSGNGRSVEGAEAQRIAREKAYQSRIESNMKKGMTYAEAKAEAKAWLDTQAALHNPDQIAGGDPTKVSRMGDKNVNSSIGAQWRTRVKELEAATNEYAKNYTKEELSKIKMNVKLEVE